MSYEIKDNGEYVIVTKAFRNNSPKKSYEYVYELSKEYYFIFLQFGKFKLVIFDGSYCGYIFSKKDIKHI